MTGAATLGEALADAAGRLAAVGIADPRREARRLVDLVFGEGQVLGWPERRIDAADAARLAALVARRAAREPFARIAGEREFWSLRFRVTADTLVPRPESETVVQAFLAWAATDRPARLLDLGTGSGCLLLAILAERPLARGIGVDRNPAALAVARANAVALGLDKRVAFVCGDWGDAFVGGFDAVICNPPYVADREIATLEPEVARFEPALALAGGADGLDPLRRIAGDLRRLLAPHGACFIEIGDGQATATERLFAEAGLATFARHPDLAGIPRCIAAAPFAGVKKKIGNRRHPD